ncbi:uncharacterized protein LOC118913596 [Manis pentadactyla]|uniref:uncharacterized protein LOC118913596 n=1 Tax=Manis pentadactyla TaxID=143292 RepID=UPI00255D1364|nr:uncharacterized protein LOC118913596 [Manis pentadactyla]
MRGMSRGRHQPPPPQRDHNPLFVPPQAQPVVIPVPLPGPRRPAPAGCEAPETPGARGGGASHAPRREPGLGAAPAARRPAPPPDETRAGPWKAKAAPLKGKKAAATTESLLRPRAGVRNWLSLAELLRSGPKFQGKLRSKFVSQSRWP